VKTVPDKHVHGLMQDCTLPCPAGCLELGYADFDQIVVDPDLDFLRQDSRFQVGGVRGW
jgi:hypothetical protein